VTVVAAAAVVVVVACRNPMLRRPGSGTRMAGSPGRDFLAVMQKLIQPLEI